MITTKPISSVAFLISLRGELSRKEIHLLENRLGDVLAEGAREIAIDLSAVSGGAFSALLDVLREVSIWLDAVGGVLLIASREVDGSSYRLACLRAGRLDSLRGLHPSLDEALTAASLGGETARATVSQCERILASSLAKP